MVNIKRLAQIHGVGMPNVTPDGVVIGPIVFSGQMVSGTPGTLDMTQASSWSKDAEMTRVFPSNKPESIVVGNRALLLIDASGLTSDQLLGVAQSVQLNIKRNGNERRINLLRALQTQAAYRSAAGAERPTTEWRAPMVLPFRFAVNLNQDTLELEWGRDGFPTTAGPVNFSFLLYGMAVQKSLAGGILDEANKCGKTTGTVEQAAAETALERTFAPPWGQ